MTNFINGGESREGDKAVGKRIYGPGVKGDIEGSMGASEANCWRRIDQYGTCTGYAM